MTNFITNLGQVSVKSPKGNVVDFQPSDAYQISLAEMTFDSKGRYKLVKPGTLFINNPGNIRVTLSNMNDNSSLLFKDVSGDFHRLVKFIWQSGTTADDFIIDQAM